MINKLLEELNQKTEILNNVLSDKKYFDDLEKRIEKVNKAYIIANVERDKYKEVLDKIKEYIKENTRYYDKELGLVEMMGANNTRTPVVYLYGLLELLAEIE